MVKLTTVLYVGSVIAHNGFTGHGLNLVYTRKHIQYSTVLKWLKEMT